MNEIDDDMLDTFTNLTSILLFSSASMSALSVSSSSVLSPSSSSSSVLSSSSSSSLAASLLSTPKSISSSSLLSLSSTTPSSLPHSRLSSAISSSSSVSSSSLPTSLLLSAVSSTFASSSEILSSSITSSAVSSSLASPNLLSSSLSAPTAASTITSPYPILSSFSTFSSSSSPAIENILIALKMLNGTGKYADEQLNSYYNNNYNYNYNQINNYSNIFTDDENIIADINNNNNNDNKNNNNDNNNNNNNNSNNYTLNEYLQFRDTTRFLIQRIFVPIVMIIGVIGNTMTIIIMTRRRMRSSTNFYLAALATMDMIYLIASFYLSFKHYENISNSDYYYYWYFVPFIHLITDACTNISVWLTVTFTIERFIVIKYPIKGKILCTESRAKKYILILSIICFLYALPTPFEWNIQVNMDNQTNQTKLTIVESEFGKNNLYRKVYYWLTTILFIFIPLTLLAIFNSFLIRAVHVSRKQRSMMTQSNIFYGSNNNQLQHQLHHYPQHQQHKMTPNTFSAQKANLNQQHLSQHHHKQQQNQLYVNQNSHNQSSSSSLSTIPSTSILSSSTKQPQQAITTNTTTSSLSSSSSSVQEIKITIMLISVVLLFLFCQSPVAAILIYTSFKEIQKNTNEDYFITGLNNIFNLLVAINAAGNFVLYSMLSQKFRRLLVQLFCPCLKGRLSRLQSYQKTLYSTTSNV